MSPQPDRRWLITGAAGMLGRDLAAVLAERGEDAVIAADRATLDLADAGAVRAAVGDLGLGGIVLNAAGWTDVDAAEDREEEALVINGTAVQTLAESCAAHDSVLVHVSTDYVFGGDGAVLDQLPEDREPAPINAYGRTKLAGEQAILRRCPDSGYLLRTAWLYGEHGPNFVATMLRLAAERETLGVVDDQSGQPTWTRDLAERMVDVATYRPPPGIYHATAAGETTWCGLARAAFALAGHDPDRISPLTTAELPRPARRPERSVLGHGRWAGSGLPPMGGWRERLARAFAAGVFG